MSLTLHYKFAEDKSLTASVGPTLSITRATDATYVDENGNIATASSGNARFTHDKNGVSLGLLVEEARTNICLQSEDFGTTWTNVRSVETVNQTIAPDGSLSADQLTDDSSTGTNSVLIQQVLTTSTSTAYCWSCFCKADQLDWVSLEVNAMASQSIYSYFDLSSGAVGATEGVDVTDSGIQDYGNGWYRCWLTFTSDSVDTSANYRIFVAEADNDRVVNLDGTSSIFIWGAQLEAGAFPTSYIRTTTGSVTRNKDLITGDVSAFIDTDNGSLFSYIDELYLDQVANQDLVSLNGGNFQNMHLHRISGGPAGSVSFDSRDGNVTQYAQVDSAVFTSGTDEVRLVTGYTENDVAMYAQGENSGTDTSCTMPSAATTLQIGALGFSGALNRFICKEVAVFNERLVNADLSDLSDGTKTVEQLAGSAPFYLAVGRRTFNGPPKQRRFPKTQRGKLRDL